MDVGEALLAQGLGGLAADGDVWDFCFQAAYMGCGDFCGGGAHPKQGLGGGDGLRQPEKGFAAWFDWVFRLPKCRGDVYKMPV